MLIRRPPEFEKTVLEPGDEWAPHVGSAGGLEMTAPARRGDLPAGDRGWLAEHGIEWGPDDAP